VYSPQTGRKSLPAIYLTKGLRLRVHKDLKKTLKEKKTQLVNELSRHFSKEVQTANKYMKKCSICLVIKEMQIKTSMRLHLSIVRIAIIKKRNNKCW
jgi:hypothetical protein